ncbi:MAG: ATP-binding protein [Patescibacteria group bacterium]
MPYSLVIDNTTGFTREMVSFLQSSSKELAASIQYEETLKNLSKLVVPRIADWFSIEILNDQGSLDLLTVNHVDQKKVKWALELRKNQKKSSKVENAALRVTKTGRSELYSNINDDLIKKTAKSKKEYQTIKNLGLKSVMIVPLKARGITRGVITFITTHDSEHSYDEADLRLAEEFAYHAAIAIDNSLLYKKAQEEIETRTNAEHRLRLAQKAANMGTFEYNLNTRGVFWSKELYDLYGLSGEEKIVHADAWNLLIHPDDRTKVEEDMKKQISLGNDLEIEFRIVKNNQKIRWIYSKSIIIRDTNGKPQKAIGINMDITERKRLEQQKDEFLSIASHELKTPITSIKAFVQILNKYFKTENESSVEYLNKMDKQVDRLTKLVHDLLDVTKIEAGKLEYNEEVFNFDELVCEVIDDMQLLTRKHKLNLESHASVYVVGDKYRISQVLTNLLSNAIKYSPEGGIIVVKTEVSDGGVIVGVKDHGIGIPKQEQNNLFKRFHRIKDKARDSYPGLGLGLYIASEIVKRENGKIWFESQENIGSTFYFKLPLSIMAPNAIV